MTPKLSTDLGNMKNGDRLSSLPDNLLITILNLLPINSAAATSVLSHRWRYLWTHITHLSIYIEFNFNFPDEINLPNLEELNLRLCDTNRVLLRTLLKSCPLLKCLRLSVMFEEDDYVVDIVAPNLEDLKIYMESHSHDCIFSVDAPNLQRFQTTDPLPIYHFVNKLSVLQQAIVAIPEYFSDERDDYLSRMVPLFQGISCARYLTFKGIFRGLYLMDVALPVFDNLIDLRIGDFRLKSDTQVPSCLLSNLKMVTISDIEPNDHGIKLLEEFLRNATVLEQLDVSVHSDYGDIINKVQMEYKFCMKLFRFPRSSSNCLINFSGSIITASSDNFKDGRLKCLIGVE